AHALTPYFPTRRSSDLNRGHVVEPLQVAIDLLPAERQQLLGTTGALGQLLSVQHIVAGLLRQPACPGHGGRNIAPGQAAVARVRSEEHTSELQSRENLV